MHVFIDTTNIVKLEEAKSNIKCQKIMFASASHEFRTPLNAIMHSFRFIGHQFDSFLKSVRQIQNENLIMIDKTAERIQKFIEIGKNSSTLLLSLIEDILDLSKIEAGTFIVNNFYFSLSELFEEVNGIFAYQCQQKRIEFEVTIQREPQIVEVFSDKGRLKQILLNLISNALKFTFEGSISWSATQEVKDGDKILIFKVKDTGIGIKENHKPRLFQLFGMISESREHNPNGTGIGLTIWKKYWEKMGGGIKLDSIYNVGTTVTFWVPFVEPNLYQNEDIGKDAFESENYLIANESLNTLRRERYMVLEKGIWESASRAINMK
jgi:two-component system, sensor histidine kinase and response regulator